jgi:hypothetical protein
MEMSFSISSSLINSVHVGVTVCGSNQHLTRRYCSPPDDKDNDDGSDDDIRVDDDNLDDNDVNMTSEKLHICTPDIRNS